MVKVKVQQGWLEGEAVEPATGDGFLHNFFSFKGIPYATPPLGKLRFKAPMLAKPWNGVRQAKEHGPICSQRCIFTNQIPPDCSEDCLYLNVYTPNLKPSAPLAVMVFIHGGGYKSGSGNVNNYGPDFLMSHNVVLVTINYRLEAFGYLCLDTEEVPGNAGMKDQVLALKWVKENISNFGGNPDNVTVFGESAGGASTALHVSSPLSKGLFKRAIPMSGVPLCDWSVAFEPRRRAFVLGKQLGLETKDPDELLQFLQSVPAEKLIGVSPCVLAAEEASNNILKMFHFTPVVEKDFGGNHFLTESPINILKSGKVNDVDVLIGYTSMESLIGLKAFEEELLETYAKIPELVVPRKILLEATPTKILEISDRIHAHYFGTKPISTQTMKEFISYSSEATFVYDIYKFIKLLANPGKNKRYLYKFSSVSNRNVYGNQGKKYGSIGAAHLDDLMYLFDAKQFDLKLETKEKKLIKQACTLFTNFAKHGDPTASTGVQWPEFGEEEFYGDIGDQLTVGQHVDAEAIAFWQSIYDYAGLKSF